MGGQGVKAHQGTFQGLYPRRPLGCIYGCTSPDFLKKITHTFLFILLSLPVKQAFGTILNLQKHFGLKRQLDISAFMIHLSNGAFISWEEYFLSPA